MKVSELMEQLKNFDPEMEVYAEGGGRYTEAGRSTLAYPQEA